MRVLLIAPQPYYAERGTPIAVRLLARTLAEQGHEVDLLAYPFGDDPRDDAVRVRRCASLPGISHIPIGFSPAKVAYDIPLSWAILRLHWRHRYDVLHAVEEAVFPALLVAALRPARVVYDMDSSLVDQLAASGRVWRLLRPMLGWFERLAVRRADHVVAVCDELVDLAARSTPREKISALYDVPNISETNVGASDIDNLRDGLPDSAKLALYVGNLERYQGIDLLLDSLKPLADREDLAVVIVGGSDAHIAHYQSLAAEAGVAARIRFVGPRPLDQLGALLKQADILLSPRITGGNTPMKLYSYMAAERAILATRLSTHTQVLDDQSAMLVEPNPADHAQGLGTLLDDESCRSKLAGNARRLATEKYSLANYKTTVREVYADLV
ncbi:MAG: glycosyltransferase family 4 protein [Pseudomonadota bacterium]